MPTGASHFFDQTVETGNVDDSELNTLDTGLNVKARSAGGLFVDITAGSYIDASTTPPTRVDKVADPDVSVSPGVTSFVYIDKDGTRQVNTTEFPGGTGGPDFEDHIPLAEVLASSTTVTSVVDRRPRIVLGGSGDASGRNFRTSQIYSVVDAEPGTSGPLASINRIYAQPIPVPRSFSFDAITFNVTVAGGGGALAQVMVYLEDLANPGEPGDLLEDASTVLVDSTGVKTVALSGTLNSGRGRVFVAIAVDDVTTEIEQYSINVAGAALLGLDASMNGQAYWDGGAHTVATAAPDPFPAATEVLDDALALGLRST